MVVEVIMYMVLQKTDFSAFTDCIGRKTEMVAVWFCYYKTIITKLHYLVTEAHGYT